MLNKQIGNVLKQFRKEKNMSQEELAHRCKLHRTYIGMIERGEKNITINSLATIASALDKKVYEIIRDAENG